MRIVASIVLSTTPMMLPVSCSRNARCEAVNSLSEASSMTALTCPSYSTGSTMTLRGRALSRPPRTWIESGGMSVEQQALAIGGRLPDQPLAERVAARLAALVTLVGVAGELFQMRGRRRSPST